MANKPESRSARRADLLLSVLCLVLGGVVWTAAAAIPPSMLSTIGAGYVPQLLAIVLAGLGLLNLMNLVSKRSEPAASRADKSDNDQNTNAAKEASGSRRRNTRRVALLVILLVAFIAALDLGLMSFWPAALVFVFACALSLSEPGRNKWRDGALTAVIGVSVAWAVFTQLFTVILP